MGRLASLTVLLAIAAAGASPAAADVLGFQSEESPPSLIGRDAAGLGSVGVDGLNLTGRPGAVTDPTAAQRRQLRAAHAAGLPAETRPTAGNRTRSVAGLPPRRRSRSPHPVRD